MEELIDILNENGIKTGEVLTRNEVHRRGLYHRAIVVAIINDENQILLQQRSFSKEKNAGMWDISVAGHVSAGQNSISATIREVKEEVNVDSKESEYEQIITYRDEKIIRDDFIENQFYDFFILKKPDLKLSNIKVQESEVEQVAFVDAKTLSEMITNKEVVERNVMYNALQSYLQKENKENFYIKR